MGRVSRSVLSLLWAGFILLLLQHEVSGTEPRPGEADETVDACLAYAAGLTLGAPLGFTQAKLRNGQPLTIAALGSSSTTGFGAFGKGTAFPDVMKQELMRLEPG